MIRIGIWSRGLMGQVLAVLLTAIMLEFLGSAVLYEYFESYSTSEEWGQQLTEQLLVADRLVSAAPIEKRPQVADQLSQEHLAFHWSHVPVRDQTGQSRALQRLRQRGCVRAEWRQTPNSQRARYYEITATGRTRLGEQVDGYAELIAAVGRVMRRA